MNNIKVLFVALLLFTPVWVQASFQDVSPSHPNYDAINYIQSQGIVEGYQDGSYKPNQTINRAEFLKIVLEAMDNPPVACEKEYNIDDVNWRSWYGIYVQKALCGSIIEGYPDGTFRPETSVNFVEAAKIITKALYPEDLVVNEIDSPWFKAYVSYLADKNAIPVTISSLDKNLTRGEMAEIMYRLLTDTTIKPSLSFESLNGEYILQMSEFLPDEEEDNEEEDATEIDLSITLPSDTQKIEMLELVNTAREEAKLPPLRFSVLLDKAAQDYADDMIARDYYNPDHTDLEGKVSNERIEETGYADAFVPGCGCSFFASENIAKGQESVLEVFTDWMNSPSHRSNILSLEFDEIGFGFKGDVWVQDFGAIRFGE